VTGFGADISASSDDESGIARTQSVTSLEESDSWPRSRRGHAEVSGRSKQAVTSSLPDLVTSSEIGRRGGMTGSFIGGVRDIDSLLGFGETEDELEVGSDEGSDGASDASFATSHERRDLRDNRTADAVRRTRSPRPAAPPHPDDVLVGAVEDIDEILGTELVPPHLGSSIIAERTAAQTATSPDTADGPPTPAGTREDVGGPLHVVIAPQTSADLSSSDSLLDTPVPDTPDVPLSPVPAFFTAAGKTQSVEQLNCPADDVAYRHSRTKSSSNLDDLDCLLRTLNGPDKKHDEDDDDEHEEDDDDDDDDSDSSDDSSSSDSSDNKSAVSEILGHVDNAAAPSKSSVTPSLPVPTDTLVDLNIPASAAASREATPAIERTRRREAAVTAALAKHAEAGQVTIGQLTDICRRQRRRKPPWIEDEEDRRFAGYQSVTEALEAMDVDVKKVRLSQFISYSVDCSLIITSIIILTYTFAVFFSPRKRGGMFLPALVCVSVCVCVCL